jgi:glycerophosphoryl diester phosphodiesterase
MKIIGHRGARGLAPENTLAAIEKGLASKADMLEVDVRVTRDGEAVLNHDKDILKVMIAEHDLTELRKHKKDLATLKATIELIKQRKPLMIEVKPGVSTDPVVAAIEHFLKRGWKADDFLLGSKSFKTLLALHQALPEIETVVIERWSGVRASYRARRLGTKRLAMNYHFLWWYFISGMAKSGYKLSAYTLNDPKKAKAWAKRGLYGVITDYPDRF